MDKGDPTYIPKKTGSRKNHREEPPTTRSSRQAERFEEEGVELISSSESVTLAQQKVLGERLKKDNESKTVIKSEKMDTDSQS